MSGPGPPGGPGPAPARIDSAVPLGRPSIWRTPSCRSAAMATSASYPAGVILVLPGPPASAEHDVDGLELGVAEQFVQALLAADAGQLHPAERHPREVRG